MLLAVLNILSWSCGVLVTPGLSLSLLPQLSAYYLQSVDGTSELSQVIYPNQDELCAPFSIVCLFHWYAYFPIKAFGSTYTFPATTALKEKQLRSLLEHWVSLVLLYYLHMWSIPQYLHYAFCSFNSFLGDSWISSALPGWWLKTFWPPLLGNLEKLMQICSSLWIWWRWQTLDCGDIRRHPPQHTCMRTHTPQRTRMYTNNTKSKTFQKQENSALKSLECQIHCQSITFHITKQMCGTHTHWESAWSPFGSVLLCCLSSSHQS